MNQLIIMVLIISLVMVTVYFTVKHCCSQPFKRSELYSIAAPGTDEYDAQMYQRYYMPPSDDEIERGGSYQMLSGDGPQLSPKDDPWLIHR